MNQENYITAMNKIELSESFKEETINLLLNGEEQDRNRRNKLIKEKQYGYRTKGNFVKVALIIFVILVGMSGITVAAMQLNIIDIFKGYFVEPAGEEASVGNTPVNNQNALNEIVTTKPLKKDDLFIEEASCIVYSSTSENGLKITVRGIVGDRRMAYFSVDVETEDGSHFSEKKENEVEGLTFSNVWLQVDDNTNGQCYITRVDDRSEIGKATFILRNSIEFDELEGNSIKHKISITFINLIEPNYDTIVDIGATKSLYDIMEEIGEASDEDIYFMGTRYSASSEAEEIKMEEDKKWYDETMLRIQEELKKSGIEKDTWDEYYKEFYSKLEEAVIERGLFTKYVIQRSDSQITFCSKFPELAVSNIGMRNNSAVVKFEFNNSISYDKFIDARIILLNQKTGEIIECSGAGGVPMEKNDDSQTDNTDYKEISCSAQFTGIISKEELRDYVFAFGGDGYSNNTLVEGEWKLDFNLDYTDTTRLYTVSDEVKLGGIIRKLKNISISPISLLLQCEATTEENDISKLDDVIKIVMLDGSAITIDNFSSDEDSYNSVLPMVIDLKQVDAIDINGIRIKLSE